MHAQSIHCLSFQVNVKINIFSMVGGIILAVYIIIGIFLNNHIIVWSEVLLNKWSLAQIQGFLLN